MSDNIAAWYSSLHRYGDPPDIQWMCDDLRIRAKCALFPVWVCVSCLLCTTWSCLFKCSISLPWLVPVFLFFKNFVHISLASCFWGSLNWVRRSWLQDLSWFWLTFLHQCQDIVMMMMRSSSSSSSWKYFELFVAMIH